MPGLTFVLLGATLLPFPQEARAAKSERHKYARVTGEVRANDGRPWAKAQVIFRERSMLGLPKPSQRIDITTQSDARGRFVARVPLGRDLTVWARSTDPSEAGRFSDLILHYRPSRERIQLVEASSRSVTVHLRPIGVDNWKTFGRIAFEIEDPSGGWLRLARDQAGDWTIPPKPGTALRLFFLVGGKVRMQAWIGLTKFEREQDRKVLERQRAKVTGKPVAGLPDVAKQPLPPTDVERLVLPPPVQLRLRVVAKCAKAAKKSLLGRLFGKKAMNDSTKGIAGATVSVTTKGSLRNPSTTTDAKGNAAILVPCPIDSWGRATHGTRSVARNTSVWITAKGREAVVIDSRSIPVIDASKVRDDHAPEHTIELPKGRGLRGQILLPAGWTQADVRLLARLPSGSPGPASTERLALLKLDDKGAFRAAGLGKDIGRLRVVLLLRRPLPEIPGQAFDLTIPTKHSNGDVDLGTTNLSKLRIVTLELALPDGRPAAYAQLLLARSYSFSGSQCAGVEVFENYNPQADRRGRCSLLTRGHDAEAFFVRFNDHYLLERLTPKQLAHGPLALVLKPIPHVSGRVLNHNGRPVAGANVHLVGSSWAQGDWRNELLGIWIDENMTATTDASGRFRLPVIPGKGLRCEVAATKFAGETTETSDILEFSTTAPPQNLEFAMDDPAAKK